MRRKCPLLFDTILEVILEENPVNKKSRMGTHPSKIQGK
jgi:hypothetical protein